MEMGGWVGGGGVRLGWRVKDGGGSDLSPVVKLTAVFLFSLLSERGTA